METRAVAARAPDAAMMVGRGRGTAIDSRTAAAAGAIGGDRRSEFREPNPREATNPRVLGFEERYEENFMHRERSEMDRMRERELGDGVLTES